MVCLDLELFGPWVVLGFSGKYQTLFLGALKSPQMVIAAMKLNDACSWEEKL